METIQLNDLSEGYHQGIMNIAYAKFKNISMSEWFDSLSTIEKYAVAAGKFNQQVENGGIYQWIDNGYAKVMCGNLINFLYTLPESETTDVIKVFINKLFDLGIEYKWGEGFSYDSESIDCDECNGSGIIECDECEGTGILETEDGETENCPCCDGIGEIICLNCDGYGTIQNDVEISNMENITNEIDFDNFDEQYYEINEKFLEICEKYFKSQYR